MAQKLDDTQQMDPAGRWKRHGNTLLTVALLIAAAVLGWKAWQSHQHNRDMAAGNDFKTLLMSVSSQQPIDDQRLHQVNELVKRITEEHGDLLYADLARLILADVAVRMDNIDAAMAALQGEIAQGHDALSTGRARIDLARLHTDRQEYDDALALLTGDMPDALSPQVLEARGDALKAMGRTQEAHEAWQKALEQAKAQNETLYGLKLKLDDLTAEENH